MCEEPAAALLAASIRHSHSHKSEVAQFVQSTSWETCTGVALPYLDHVWIQSLILPHQHLCLSQETRSQQPKVGASNILLFKGCAANDSMRTGSAGAEVAGGSKKPQAIWERNAVKGVPRGSVLPSTDPIRFPYVWVTPACTLARVTCQVPRGGVHSYGRSLPPPSSSVMFSDGLASNTRIVVSFLSEYAHASRKCPGPLRSLHHIVLYRDWQVYRCSQRRPQTNVEKREQRVHVVRR